MTSPQLMPRRVVSLSASPALMARTCQCCCNQCKLSKPQPKKRPENYVVYVYIVLVVLLCAMVCRFLRRTVAKLSASPLLTAFPPVCTSMFSTTTSVASRFVGRCCEGKLASRRFASSLRLAATARVPGARTSRFSRALGLVGGSGVRVKGAWRTPTQARLVSTACRSTACGVAPPSSPDSPDSVVDDTVDGSAIPSLKDVPGTQRGETFIMMFTCNQCDTRSARQISKVCRQRCVCVGARVLVGVRV